MAITETIPGISPELMAELQEAAERAAQGVRDPEAMRQACQSLNRLREEIHQQHGVLDVVVPALRELRDDA
jgi:succinate dehydrogenase/fumarate reductase flavoprotein subunit